MLVVEMTNHHASALGKMARGKPKNFSPEEIARRTRILDEVNARRRRAAKKRAKPRRPKSKRH
jgi:hypothetical protein